MKKALTLLLAAVLSGLASAVTLNWSEGYNAGSTASANWGTKTKLEVKIVFNATGLDTAASKKQDVFSVCLNGTNNTNNSLVVRRMQNATKSIRLVANGSNSGTDYSTKDVDFRNGENTLTFLFDKTTGVASYILNGGTETNVGNGDRTYSFASDGTINLSIGAGITALGSITSVEAKLVPEPTVLALLAVGVAGLALRRKQA